MFRNEGATEKLFGLAVGEKVDIYLLSILIDSNRSIDFSRIADL